ncbi:AAA family ATPase [Agrobacterium vitis]|nr:AAA family ATPase [Agrobacterium vitis]
MIGPITISCIFSLGRRLSQEQQPLRNKRDMIDQISIENFMRLEDCKNISLGPLTLLVGQNGSGKSSVLKAIHWASRCASLAQNKKLQLELMDFVPSLEFRSLAHKSTLQGRERGGSSTKPVIVKFKHGIETGSIKLKSLGNDAGVNVEIEGDVAAKFVQEEPQTAYIPGLAGLAEHETILAAPVFKRKAASGDGGSVLRQMLLNTHSDELNTGDESVELTTLSELVSQVIPGVRFWVKFDQRRDAFIRAWFYTPDMKYGDGGSNYTTMRRPLEMAGTGLLQVTQIFAYLLTFRPRLLLIDEPDAHLHQSSQERLVTALEAALQNFPETQIIVSTHSPRIVRVAGQSTKVIWLENGAVRDQGKDVRTRMGWGALDKDIIMFSEDDNTEYLQSIIDQWPHLAHRTVIWPCFGVSSIPTGERLAKLRDRHGIKAIVHRDRDFMSDEDLAAWKVKRHYSAHNVPVWFSPGSDIESCFHSADHIARALDVDQAIVERGIEYALNQLDQGTVSASFNEAYNKAVESLPGQANAIKRWTDLGPFSQATVKGKSFKAALKTGLQNSLPEAGQARKLGNMSKIYEGFSENPICDDLRSLLQELLDQ